MKEKKKRVNGRAKGSAFERTVAKLFGKWTGYEFRRTPMSGGWSHNNPDTSGDLICMEKGIDFPFHVECKNKESWSMEGIIKGSCKEYTNWYAQVDKALPEGKRPIIVFSKNNSPVYATSYIKHYRSFVDRCIASGDFILLKGDKFITLFGIFTSVNYEIYYGNKA